MCQLATPTDGRHRLARPRRSVAVGQSHLGRKPRWPGRELRSDTPPMARAGLPGPMVAPAGRGGGRDRSRAGSSVKRGGVGDWTRCSAAVRGTNTAAGCWESRHPLRAVRERTEVVRCASAGGCFRCSSRVVPEGVPRRTVLGVAPAIWQRRQGHSGNPGPSRADASRWRLRDDAFE